MSAASLKTDRFVAHCPSCGFTIDVERAATEAEMQRVRDHARRKHHIVVITEERTMTPVDG